MKNKVKLKSLLPLCIKGIGGILFSIVVVSLYGEKVHVEVMNFISISMILSVVSRFGSEQYMIKHESISSINGKKSNLVARVFSEIILSSLLLLTLSFILLAVVSILSFFGESPINNIEILQVLLCSFFLNTIYIASTHIKLSDNEYLFPILDINAVLFFCTIIIYFIIKDHSPLKILFLTILAVNSLLFLYYHLKITTVKKGKILNLTKVSFFAKNKRRERILFTFSNITNSVVQWISVIVISTAFEVKEASQLIMMLKIGGCFSLVLTFLNAFFAKRIRYLFLNDDLVSLNLLTKKIVIIYFILGFSVLTFLILSNYLYFLIFNERFMDIPIIVFSVIMLAFATSIILGPSGIYLTMLNLEKYGITIKVFASISLLFLFSLGSTLSFIFGLVFFYSLSNILSIYILKTKFNVWYII